MSAVAVFSLYHVLIAPVGKRKLANKLTSLNVYAKNTLACLLAALTL